MYISLYVICRQRSARSHGTHAENRPKQKDITSCSYVILTGLRDKRMTVSLAVTNFSNRHTVAFSNFSHPYGQFNISIANETGERYHRHMEQRERSYRRNSSVRVVESSGPDENTIALTEREKNTKSAMSRCRRR